MSFLNMLTDVCDIYHLKAEDSSTKPTFGVSVENMQQQYDYPDEPDLSKVPAYFVEKSQSIAQGEPQRQLIQTYKVFFLPDTDVRTNDRVIFEEDAFRLQKPRRIRNHHIEVAAVREEEAL
ncbi:DUF3599 family protein [Terribacillus sp. 7520-G]|uniref:DUF3599 family protein n=1 Tax=Terribacillus TaxID=459532 RepID=UPI000BA6A02E|nr:DUF3599 family protein [Terribacillus sp. 7520-G]PAD38612.1 DUF3599 domain-containing protein [Terribacillus sp. 7520-G]